VCNQQPTLSHHLDQIAVAQFIAEIPAQAQNDDFVLKPPASTNATSAMAKGKLSAEALEWHVNLSGPRSILARRAAVGRESP
jgi:hypothetical protein